MLGWAARGWTKCKGCSLVLFLRIHLLCKCYRRLSDPLKHCLAVQVRGEKFWLRIKTKSCQSWCWKGWLAFRSVPSALWDCRGSSESCGAQKHSHVTPAVSLGLKPLQCRAAVFSLHQLSGVLPHQVLPTELSVPVEAWEAEGCGSKLTPCLPGVGWGPCTPFLIRSGI